MKTYNYIYKNKNEFLAKLDKFDRFSKNILIQVFSGDLEKNNLDILRQDLLEIFPNSNISGTTTDGEILNGKVTSGQIIVSISVFDKTKVKSKFYECTSKKSALSIFQKIDNELIFDNTKSLIIFSDWKCNIEDVLNFIYKKYPDIKISGGKAGDNYNFINPYLFDKNTISNNGIVITSLSGDDLNVYTNYNFSWTKIGKQMTVTKASGKRIYELNNLPVSQIYEKYLGKVIADQLPQTGVQFPLIIDKDGVDVARDVLQKFEDGSLLLAGNISVGDKVNFGCGNSDDILNGIYSIIKDSENIPIESIFMYSCTARKNFLGKEIIEEILPISKVYNTVGFFTYGEFYHTNIGNEVLNETLTFLCISEKTEADKKNIDQIKKVIKSKNIKTTKERNSYFALSNLVKVTNAELRQANESLFEWNKNLEDKIMETSRKIETQKDKYFEGYKSIIDNSNEMICIINKGKVITYVNKQVENTTGYSNSELQNMQIMDLFLINDGFDYMSFDCNHKKMKLITKDNELINVLVTKFDFLDEGHTIIIKNLEEILKLKEAYNKLKELDKKKDDFLNIASHELRTPMTTIKGYISMLIDGDIGKIDEIAKKYLHIISNDSDRLINLINDMLDISKIESGKMTFNFEETSMPKFIENIVFDMQLIANPKFILIKTNFNYEEFKFQTDKQRLKQVLINIIGNAIKFTPEYGEIEVKSYLDDKNLYIDITDSGIGIHQIDIPKIFEKFGQISNSLSRETGGSGLGLPIALNIVKKLKGDIKVESKIGEGSTFKIILPL